MGRSKYQYLVKNIGLFTLSSFATKILSALLLPLYTTFLVDEQFGSIDIIYVTVTLLIPILTLSIHDGVLRFAMDQCEDKKKVFSLGMEVTVAGCVLLTLLMPVYGQISTFADFKFHFLALYIVSAFNSIFANFARTVDQVKLITISSIAASAVTMGLNVFLIAGPPRMGVDGYLFSMIVGNLVGCVIYFFFGRMYRYLTLQGFDKALFKRMILYSIPLIPNHLFWLINSSLDRYCLTAITGLAATGLYALASKIPTLLNTLTSIFQQAWSISAIKEYQTEEGERFFSSIHRIFSYVMLLSSSLLVALCQYLAMFFFQGENYQAWSLIPLLALAFYYSSLNSFLGSVYTATKRTKSLFVTTAAGAGVNVAFNLLLIPFFGPYGAAVATCLSHFAVWLARSITSRKIIRIQVDYKRMIPSQVLLVLQVGLMTAQTGILWSAGIFVVIFLLNLSTFKQAKDFLWSRLKKRAR